MRMCLCWGGITAVPTRTKQKTNTVYFEHKIPKIPVFKILGKGVQAYYFGNPDFVI